MDEPTEPSVRKCSTSSTSSNGSSTSSGGSSTSSGGGGGSSPSSGGIAMLDEDHEATTAVGSAFDAMMIAGVQQRYPSTVVVVNKGPDSDIHTDRSDCSSSTDGSNSAPDSPSELLKRVGSVYDFELDGPDHPPPGNPFVVGGGDLTKVARKQLRMIREANVAVCHLNHTNTIISKLLSCKYLRRWENHQIRILDDYITSKTSIGFLSKPIDYSAIKDLYAVKRWDSNFRYCLRVVITNGSYLLQTTNRYLRDQILYSISWKKNVYETQILLKSQSDPDDMLQELQNVVDFAKNIPLTDDELFHMPTSIATTLMTKVQDKYCKQSWEKLLIGTLRPLIEDCPPSTEMCSFFSHHCKDPSSLPIIKDSLVFTITKILKSNIDFLGTLTARTLVQDFIKALYTQDQSGESIRLFISKVHSASALCPHHRVLPNMVSTCNTAMYTALEELPANCSDAEFDCYYTNHLRCYIVLLQNISEYSDWLLLFAQLLSPLPFPTSLLTRSIFMADMSSVILKIGLHENCEIHMQVLAVRDTKDGWFDLCSPLGAVFGGSSFIWTQMLQTLMNCERCKKKKLLNHLKSTHLGTCVSEALKNNTIVMDALCLMLEWNVVEDLQQRNQIIDTLKSTESGKIVYDDFMSRQNQLLELQRKGGPQKLSLPARGTDLDLNSMFGCGPFGNLESIDLAFTNVTDTCAKTLIKLPYLKVLNLWGTQFGDSGLLIISDHLTNLQVLNLCETRVTDEGIVSLISLINLKKLNLNSTKATFRSVDVLKKKLPGLHEVDVRYTYAW